MIRSTGATWSGSEYRLRMVWLATSPTVWPMSASPTSSEATARRRMPGVLPVSERASRGVSRSPTANPIDSPSHDSARTTKPTRNPTTAPAATATRTTTSSAFIRSE